MRNRTLLKLTIAGAVLVTLAWITSRDKTDRTDRRIGRALLPGLDVNRVDEIRISTHDATTRVVRTESGWTLPQRHGYPANFETIRRLLLKLENLKIGQVSPVNDAQRERLELTGNTATRVELVESGRPLAEFRMGAARQPRDISESPYGIGGMSSGRFIMLQDPKEAFLVKDMLFEITPEPRRWMDTQLLDVPSDQVEAVEIKNPDDGSFALRRDDQGNWHFDPADENAPFDPSKAYLLTGAFGYLTLEDVADPALDDHALGFDEASSLFRIMTRDGIRYTLRIGNPAGEGNDTRYARIAVEPPAPSETASEATDSEDTDAAKTPDPGEAAARAAALHTRLSRWTFRLPSYKTSALLVSRDSLVKQPEPVNDSETENADSPQDDDEQP